MRSVNLKWLGEVADGAPIRNGTILSTSTVSPINDRNFGSANIYNILALIRKSDPRKLVELLLSA